MLKLVPSFVFGVIFTLGTVIPFEEFRLHQAEKQIREYEELKQRVDEHNHRAIEKTMEKYNSRVTD
jgi:hypothetical protein